MYIHKLITVAAHFFHFFLPINFIISFSIQVVKTIILTQQTLSFFLFLLSLSNLLRAMVIKFPCGIRLKPVANNHQAIKCGKCNLWIHIKCNKINKQT